MAIIIEPTIQHGNIMKRLKDTLEAERKQRRLVTEMDLDSGMNILTKADSPSISFHSYRSQERQESQDCSIIYTNSGDH
jgi:hypothetical protein